MSKVVVGKRKIKFPIAEIRKDVKQVVKREEEKKEFKDMTPEEKRVEIARDVLAQIRMGQFKAGMGYMQVFPVDDNKYTHEFYGCQLNTAVKKGEVRCEGCADGALFMAYVMRYNHLNVKTANTDVSKEYIKSRMRRLFSKDQLDLIETAYERCVIHGDGNISKELARRTISWGTRYDNREKRLKAIMRNIIRNNGTFKP